MTVQNWKFVVEALDAGLRLDQVVSQHTGLSRRKAREILQLGGVQVERSRVRVASKQVKLGHEIRVALDDALGPLPDMDLDVVFEDEWLLVLNKPAGLPTQGTQASDRHDLMALVARKRPGLKPILCHRLDQGTSGVLVLAKDPKANLGPAFQERSANKTYLARITAPLKVSEAEIRPEVTREIRVDKPIGRLRLSHPARFACEGDVIDAKPSATRFRLATDAEAQGLVKGLWIVAMPETGRTHQIRVHLASIGAPILGDGLYGGQPDAQLWLHAWKLRLRHPVTDVELEFIAESTRFHSSECP